MTSNEDWLSTQEAAKALGITPRTLYRFIDEGSLVAYRFGRVIRLKQGDVDAFIDGSVASSTCHRDSSIVEALCAGPVEAAAGHGVESVLDAA